MGTGARIRENRQMRHSGGMRLNDRFFEAKTMNDRI